jgi:hypothetical protein
MPEVPRQSPAIPAADLQPPNVSSDDLVDEEAIKQEVAQLTPSNEKLLELVDKLPPPPPEWLDDEEEPPF